MPSFSALLELGKRLWECAAGRIGSTVWTGEPKKKIKEEKKQNQGEEYLAWLVVFQNVDYFCLLRGFPDSEVGAFRCCKWEM